MQERIPSRYRAAVAGEADSIQVIDPPEYLRARRPVTPLPAAVPPPETATPQLLSPWAVRFFEVLPGALAIFLISTLVWGYAFVPVPLAIVLLAFDSYWLWKSWTIGYHVVKGSRLLKRAAATNWRYEYIREQIERPNDVLPWEGIRHVVVIPTYKESPEKLRETLDVLAAAAGAWESIIPVLALEAAEAGAAEKGEALRAEYADSFLEMLVTVHPAGLPDETRGKSSNEAWAAREAYRDLVGRGIIDPDLTTITSCDADTQFPDQYFECLTYKFATDPMRYRRFWQAPIFFYNNIWQVPAPLRIPNAMGGLIHLSRLSRSRRVLFSQSTYSLSLRMAYDAGFWDVDVIPEDWHMFLKCYYRFHGEVEVEPIYLPIGNDGALSHTTWATFMNQYLQVRRWAWGAVDIAYTADMTLRHTEIPLKRRLVRAWYVFENHLSWSTQWFFITLGGAIPFFANLIFGVQLMPDWFGWGSRLLLTPCMLPYLMLIYLDSRLRPPGPPSTVAKKLRDSVYWFLLPPITFFFSALPALDAQMRLLLGRRMEYRVTEKA
jgi:hypothetical protein